MNTDEPTPIFDELLIRTLFDEVDADRPSRGERLADWATGEAGYRLVLLFLALVLAVFGLAILVGAS